MDTNVARRVLPIVLFLQQFDLNGVELLVVLAQWFVGDVLGHCCRFLLLLPFAFLLLRGHGEDNDLEEAKERESKASYSSGKRERYCTQRDSQVETNEGFRRCSE